MDRLDAHYERTVSRLVAAHVRNEQEPLIAAIRFQGDEPDDIYLLEVIENWPGDADDPLFKTEFGPSAELVVLGKLHLWLANPAQLRHAIQQRDPVLEQVRRIATVVFQADAPDARDNLARSLLDGLNASR